jgi:hypothetical protein
VWNGLVQPGDIYADPEPEVLWAFGSDNPGVVFHVLGMRKAKSDDSSGELVRYDFNDPNAPATAWTTYDYRIAIPGVDTNVPFRLLLARSGEPPTAKRINNVLRKRPTQPPWATAFELTSVRQGRRFVPRVRVASGLG